MRVCIVYDTKRGSTERVARAMAKAVGGIAKVGVFGVTENPDVERYDLIVIGAPVYYERPLPEVKEFLLSKNGLEEKAIAVFILCIADKFGKLGKKYTERRYLRMMTEHIRGRIIAVRVFDGWILREDPKTIGEAENWIKRVLDAFKSGEELGIEHPEGE